MGSDYWISSRHPNIGIPDVVDSSQLTSHQLPRLGLTWRANIESGNDQMPLSFMGRTPVLQNDVYLHSTTGMKVPRGDPALPKTFVRAQSCSPIRPYDGPHSRTSVQKNGAKVIPMTVSICWGPIEKAGPIASQYARSK